MYFKSLICFLSVVLVFGFIGCSKPNNNPTISALNSDITTVAPKAAAKLSCVASDADNNPLTYKWSASNGTISGEGAEVEFVAPEVSGVCTISVEIEDGKGGSDSKSIEITVNAKPVISSLTAMPSEVFTSDSTILSCIATDAESDVLKYEWTASSGSISGEGATVTFVAPDKPDTCTITVKVSESNGGADEKKLEIKVSEKPAPKAKVKAAKSKK